MVSCPGDVGSELPLIDKAVEEFNRLYSDALGIIVQTKHWSKSSYPQSGDRPQALLNEQFVKDCDAAVALYVGPKTPFFELFEVHPYGRYETNGYSLSDPMGKDLDKWYHVIMKYLPENER